MNIDILCSTLDTSCSTSTANDDDYDCDWMRDFLEAEELFEQFPYYPSSKPTYIDYFLNKHDSKYNNTDVEYYLDRHW